MARSSFYYYLKQLDKEEKYISELDMIRQIYHTHKGRYGYRRITSELHKYGYTINHKTVQKLMNTCGLKSLVRPKKYRSYKGERGRIAPNLLERDFKAENMNQKWVTDVTEFSLLGTKSYLSPIMDLCNREIISYCLSEHPTYHMVSEMLDDAFKKIPDGTELILHSDQGYLYQLEKYNRKLNEKGIRQSMSRKGNCLDNAVIENFFGLLKSEWLYLQTFSTKDEFIKELDQYIYYYNNLRIKLNLKGLSPVQYRTQILDRY